MVRFHLGGTGSGTGDGKTSKERLLELPCSEFDFLSDELIDQSVNKKRDHLEAVSYGAYQISALSGNWKDKSWKQYQKQFGLGSDESQKVDPEEKDEVLKKASSLHEKLMKARNNVKKKNI